MAWYHQHQYASLGKKGTEAYPILAWEISNDGMHILSVKLKITETDCRWYQMGDIELFSSCKDFILLYEQRTAESTIDRFLKKFNLKRI